MRASHISLAMMQVLTRIWAQARVWAQIRLFWAYRKTETPTLQEL